MKLPECIGFIMDGNRRWAKEQNLPTLKGHEEGFESFKRTVESCLDLGVKNMIFYTFSTENWKRSEKELDYLFKLMGDAFKDLELVHKHKLKVRFIGEREKFSATLRKSMEDLENNTKSYNNGLVVFALSYGGRAEILDAVNSIISEGIKSPLDEKAFEEYLWTKDIPDPDIVIRTGEAMRLSNFLPWQSVYSELYFTSTYWPDFDREELQYVLEEYSNRERRMGK